MGRRRKEQALPPAAGLKGKSLSQVAAEAAALGLTYGQYTVLVETGALEAWRKNESAGENRQKQRRE